MFPIEDSADDTSSRQKWNILRVILKQIMDNEIHKITNKFIPNENCNNNVY